MDTSTQYQKLVEENEELKVAYKKLKQQLHDYQQSLQTLEYALQESELRYRTFFHENRSVMLLINPQTGKIVDANQSACQYYGYSYPHLTTMSISQINTISPDRLLLAMQNVVEKKHSHFFFTHRLASGHIRHVEVFTGKIKMQGQTLIFSIVHDIEDRYKAERALKESEEKYRSIVAAMNEGVIMQNVRGVIITANLAAQRILGVADTQLMGKSLEEDIWQAIYEDGSPFPSEMHPAMLALHTGRPQHNIIMGVYKPNGNLSWITINSEPLFIENTKRPYAVVSFFADITKQINTEKALKESEARYKLLSNLTFEGIVIHQNGIVKDVNESLLKLLGYQQKELIGENIIELCVPFASDRQLIDKNIIKEQATPYIIRMARKDKTLFYAELEAKDIYFGVETLRIAAVRDVSKRIKIEQQRDEDLRGFEFLSHSVSHLISLNDKDDIFHYIGHSLKYLIPNALIILNNKIFNNDVKDSNVKMRVTAIYGLEEFLLEKIIRVIRFNPINKIIKNNQEIYHLLLKGTLEEVQCDFQTVLQENVPPYAFKRLRRFFRPTKFYIIGFPGEHGLLGCIQIYTFQGEDIKNKDFVEILANQTSAVLNKNHVEELLIHARDKAEKANRSKSEFIANISHEIRTPMNVILGFTDILKEKLNSQPQYADYLDGVMNSGKTLLNLINDILDLSKIEAKHLEIKVSPVCLQGLLNEIKQVFFVKANEKNLEFSVNMPIEFPACILIDEARLRQILFNLIGNAIKFTDRGYVHVVISHWQINQANDSIDFSITVSDSGIGIKEEELDFVFEPFRQQEEQNVKKYGGTGLGLSITKRLVEAMHGKIGVESEIGKGSAFTIGFKNISLSDPPQEKEAVVLDDIEFLETTILLVDDDSNNRRILKTYLSKYSFLLFEAENGLEALKMVKLYHPDLIITDIYMPKMNGNQLAKIIKSDANYPAMPIIAQTVSSELEKHSKYFNDVILKPISKQVLVKCLKQYLPYKQKNKNQSLEKPPTEDLKSFIQTIHIDCSTPCLSMLSELGAECQHLQTHLSMPEITLFAEKIEKIAQQFTMTPLLKYAQQLKIAADNYDIDKIVKLLKIFNF